MSIFGTEQLSIMRTLEYVGGIIVSTLYLAITKLI